MLQPIQTNYILACRLKPTSYFFTMKSTLALIFLFAFTAHAQNINYVKGVVNTLCSDQFYGRGYVKGGDKKAASYIADELKASKLKAFGGSYFQEFGFPVVAFGGDIILEVDKHHLLPGKHFLVSPGCGAINGWFNMVWVDSATIDDDQLYQSFLKQNLRNSFIVITHLKKQKVLHADRVEALLKNKFYAKGIIHAAETKLTWSVATNFDKFPQLYVLDGWLKPYQNSFKLLVETEQKNHQTQNVLGYIEGTTYKDSFVVYTAHYDHLGMMGLDAIFPGANDNASGVAMLLDLVKYYSQNKPKYNVAFIFFAGEEVGLFGSYYYTQNPVFPLKQIALLLNLDLMGTGDKGLTAVNATEFKAEFEMLQLVNMDGDYLPTIAARGKAQNSDHYYFTEQGVKSFFFYLMGDYHYYHDVDDRAEALPLSKYNEAFKLITQFVKEYQTVH